MEPICTNATASEAAENAIELDGGVNTQSKTGKWDRRFLDLASHVAGWSKDRSTKVGCVLVGPDKEVISLGYNGLPRGVDDDVEARHARPAKYQFAEHAERNAIFNAARIGVSCRGATAYVSGIFCCADCARAIIQAGIAKVVSNGALPERWAESNAAALEMLREAGVIVITA